MQKVRILLVDDDKVTLLLHKTALAECGEVFTAINGYEALHLIRRKGPFAVVVSDQYMPEMNGVEFLQRVCSIAPYTSRIMITGLADLDVAMQAVNRGNVFRFLVKSCNKDELIAAVKDGIELYRNADGDSAAQYRIAGFLTEREKEAMQLLSRGFSNKDIALEMGVSVGTVKTHINNIFGKFDVNNRTQAVIFAKSGGII